MSTPRPLRLVTGMSLVLMGGVAVWMMRSHPPVASPPGASAMAHAVGAPSSQPAGMVEGAVTPVVMRTGLEGLPASLRGTILPGRLAVDANGNLVIDHGIRELFDYFLSASADESVDIIRTRIAALGKSQLPPVAAAQLDALFARYLDFKQAAPPGTASAASPDVAQLRARAASRRLQRGQYFTPAVIAAFFGDEDRYDDYQLAKAEVLQDASLGPTEKSRRLAELRGALPAAMRDALSVAETVDTLNALTEELRKRGGDATELHAAREALVGAAATQRLETLDRETAAWNARVQDYLNRRQSLQIDPALSEPMRQQQIDALRGSIFNSEELVRVSALERIHDSQDDSGSVQSYSH